MPDPRARDRDAFTLSGRPKGRIGFAVSGMKHYENRFYRNRPRSFAALSVTGSGCGRGCPHCGGLLLRSMEDAGAAGAFRARVDKAAEAGCSGILVSGGSGADGAVPVLPAIRGIAYAKEKGLKVLVHTGLAGPETAFALKEAGADQVLPDLIGSDSAIRGVYGLEKSPEDYRASLLACLDAGLAVAPHIVIGLDFGRIEGEYKAVDMAAEAGAERLILVVLTPQRGTAMEGVTPPPLADVIRVIRYAADALGGARVALGCARPPACAAALEIAAVDLGFHAIAYPHAETIRYAIGRGLEPVFFEECCSLAGDHLG